MPSSGTTGNVFLNDISAIEISITTDIVRVFLRELSIIKNMGNKMLTIIIEIQFITKIPFQLVNSILITVSAKVKVEVNSAKISNDSKDIKPPAIRERVIKIGRASCRERVS